jgi:hypothetical protein
MKWLEAALAFALIMLVLATVVTIILESLYKLLLTREKGFRLMMARMFDEVLKPRVGHLLRGVTLSEARERFLDMVTQNQAYEEKHNVVRDRVQPDQLSSMTMMQFADRLADTDVGRAIARGGSEYVENAINDLTLKFDRFGAATSRRFQDQARFWCVLVSVMLAFAANVDAVRLIQSLVRDEALTDEVIAKYGGAVSDSASRPKDAVESLKAMAELRDEKVINEAEFTAFKESLATTQLKLGELRDTGLPVTVAAWPFCAGAIDKAQPKKAWDGRCAGVTQSLMSWQGAAEVAARLWSSDGLGWFFSVLLAGALIGLGAPFWFDLARGLTRTVQLMGASPSRKEPDKPPPATSERASPPPSTPVEAFKVAIAAARPPRARILLSSSGRPIRGLLG